MNSIAELFLRIGEPYARGLFEAPERSLFERHARAQRRFWESLEWTPYAGGDLYPSGMKCPKSHCVSPDYSFTFSVREKALAAVSPEALAHMQTLAAPVALSGPHFVGGAGYTHSIPNYGRILKEGFIGYEKRIRAMNDESMREGLLDLLEGIRVLHQRALAHLVAANAPALLCEALKAVPFQPAKTLYEALVCWNFIYYLDFCDNPGRLDADLWLYYRGEDMTAVFRQLFENVDANDGWTGALGPDYNALTLQCLSAAQGLRRPSLELRVTRDMPREVWDAAIESVYAGGGQPAFYSEEGYQNALAQTFPQIPPEDRLAFCGGGCTETMLAGLSNVGSLDAGLNLALIFATYLRDQLCASGSFEAFYEGFFLATRDALLPVLDRVNAYREHRAQTRPHPVRTLLIDDCIERERDFNDGGARYAWSVINVAGLINAIDSMLAVRALVFDKNEYAPDVFLRLLDQADERFFAHLRTAPCYGVDDACADALAADMSGRVFELFALRVAYPETVFLPSSIQFTTYADAGKGVAATPDGRKAGEPLNDSLAPVHGKDKLGATAMLSSAMKLPQARALGTPVLNLRIQKSHGKDALRALIQT